MAASAIYRRIDLPLLFELGSQFALFGRRCRVPIHVKDLRGRAKEILGCTMTIQAPLHAERLGLVDNAHLVYRTMATVAADSAVHMDGMVEISVIGEAVDLHPRNRFAAFPTVADGGKARTVRQNLALTVTVDAGLGGWKVRVTRHLDEAMAVAAVHPKLLHVQGVGEGNRLIGLVADTCILWREIIPDPQRDGPTDHQAAD